MAARAQGRRASRSYKQEVGFEQLFFESRDLDGDRARPFYCFQAV
jgi:hypothetical protein